MSTNKGLKYFTLCVINLYNIWVSLSEMSDKKYWPLSWYSIFIRCTCSSTLLKKLHNLEYKCSEQVTFQGLIVRVRELFKSYMSNSNCDVWFNKQHNNEYLVYPGECSLNTSYYGSEMLSQVFFSLIICLSLDHSGLCAPGCMTSHLLPAVGTMSG